MIKSNKCVIFVKQLHKVIRKEMKKYIKDQVYKKILNDNRLSFEISEALGIQQQSVMQSARRRSHRVFRDVLIIDILKKEGLNENEIFEQVKK